MSKIKAIQIDSNGYFLEDVLVDSYHEANEKGLITTFVKEGIHTPFWNGTEWIEGKTDAELLEKAINDKIAELNAKCRETIVNGYSVAINSTDTYTYESELHDQRNLALKGLKVLMDTNITSVNHKTVEKGIITHTRDEFLKVVRESDTHIDTNLTKYRDLKAKVKACTTIIDVENIVW